MGERKNAVIIAYGRSAITKGNKGSFAGQHPAEYAAQVLTGVLNKVPELRHNDIEDLIVGCAKPEGVQGSNFARVIAQRAGLPDEVAGQTVNRFCASGLQAIATAANAIMAGQAEVLVAGGVEDMTDMPMASSPESRNKWVAENTSVYVPMGVTAENVAELYGLSRAELDAMAVDSHKKAVKAQAEGKFDSQIIPVTLINAQGESATITKDEGIRPDTSMEGLANLKTVFKENGVVTAGTSSQVSDGAGFVVMMEEERAIREGFRPIARVLAFSVAGTKPETMGLGPIYAVPKALKLAGISVEDLDVVELNEAFAAQAIPCIKELKLPIKKVNPYGGALALGHPLGATGAILTSKALAYLEEHDGTYALVSMCIGGGMGAAAVFQRLK